MRRCLQLARLGEGYTWPNPMVGAVLVCNNEIIGEGWHKAYGGPHAEVNCIASVPEHQKHLISRAVMYVSLEPCAHYGKTPPCASLLIQYHIPKVVVGCVDAFGAVSGKGIAMLQDAGTEVVVGVLEEECKELNRFFFTFHHKKRPYILLKWAMTADGFIGPEDGRPLRISNEATQLLLHKWRGTVPAFAVGFNTVVKDNPRLSNRLWPNGQQPVRVILDPGNTLPCKSHIFDGEQPTLIYNRHFSMDGDMTQWVSITHPSFLEGILEDLYQKQIVAVVVEGGARTLQLFIDQQCYDEIITFQSRQSLCKGIQAPVFKKASRMEHYLLYDNEVTHYYY